MRIIVVTPVKNEAWILPIFLKASLRFADHIIIADQASTDNSKQIASSFDKVTVIDNTSTQYGEDYRQHLLIETAREKFPGPKIIFALDADEIISADSLETPDWNLIKNSKKETVFYFEKPELYRHPSKTIRYRHNLYPLAFVDDDTISHKATKVHSIRVPLIEGHYRQNIDNITFLHASYLRPNVQRAKYRFYSVKENDLASSPWYRRRRRYRSPNHLLFWEPVEKSPAQWFEYPEELDIDFCKIKDCGENWYNDDIMKSLAKNGSLKYWLDDIWDEDWNKLLQTSGRKPVLKQPRLFNWLLKKIDRFL